MKNILVNITDLQPGDTWDEHGGCVYVVYKVEPARTHSVFVSMIQIKDGQYRNVTMLYGTSVTLVVDRPEAKA